MKPDPVVGMTLRWTFDDGIMQGKTFEHTFAADGTVTWCGCAGETKEKPTKEARYELQRLNPDVVTVAYLGRSGWTLTVVLDFKTSRLVSISSNEKQLMSARGTFSPVSATTQASARPM